MSVAQVAVEASYRDVERLIYKTVWKHQKRFGGEFGELLSSANKAFLEAYEDYDGSSLFSTWVVNKVRYALLNHIRSESKFTSHFRTNCFEARREQDAIDEIPEQEAPETRMELILRDLSDDARIIVRLLIETPTELSTVVCCRKPEKIRQGLWRYLKHAGWSLARVVNCYEEIRLVLASIR